MKFKNNDKVETLIDKGNIKKGSIGYIVCDFTEPNEAYDVEFWNDEDSAPYGYETYLPSEIKSVK
jgi:hypothetical protein